MTEEFCPVIDLVLAGVEKGETSVFHTKRATPIGCDPVVSGGVVMQFGCKGIKATIEQIEWCYSFSFTTSDGSFLEVGVTSLSPVWNLHRKLLPDSADMSLRKFYEHYFEKCDKVKLEEIINTVMLL